MALTLRLATPQEIPAGYWDQCPHCRAPVFLPVAGARESKEPVRCPACQGAIKPDC